MEQKDSSKISPPYISWETLTGFLKPLKDAPTIPNRIDSSMMPSTMSGFNKAGVTSALKFFSLIDSNGEITDNLKEVVEAYETARWPEAVKTILVPAYRNIIGDLKLNSATRKELDEKFEGTSFGMKDKFIRFYILMLTDAGEQISKWLTARQSKPEKSSPRKTTKKEKQRTPQGGEQHENTNQQTHHNAPDGMWDLPIPIESVDKCFIRIPKVITVEQVNLVKGAIAYLEAIAKSKENK